MLHRLHRLSLAFVCVLWAAGCEGHFDDQGETVEGWCPSQALELLRPRADSTEAYVGGWVVSTLECAPAWAEIELSTPAGAPIEGELSNHHDGAQYRFRSSDFLEPLTTYDVRLRTSRRFNNWSFSTSALGIPTSEALPGRTLSVKPRTGLLLEPPGLAEILDELLLPFAPVLEFTHPPANGSVPIRMGGRLAGSVQDPSQRVLDLPASWDDPFWSFGPFDLAWILEEGQIKLDQATFSGAVHSTIDGAGGGISIWGTWDPRPAESELGVTLQDLCDLSLDKGGQGCVPCSDGVETCLPFALVHIEADLWSGSLDPNL
ncbi:MAG: hypothetical protein VX498_09630 [Myxococcota bacterium]|nr:hypothetical protein [Myxococcota bacterium]